MILEEVHSGCKKRSGESIYTDRKRTPKFDFLGDMGTVIASFSFSSSHHEIGGSILCKIFWDAARFPQKHMTVGELVIWGAISHAKVRGHKVQTTQEWDFHGPSSLCQLPLNFSQCWLAMLRCRCGSCRHGSVLARHCFRYWLRFKLTHRLRDIYILCRKGDVWREGHSGQDLPLPSVRWAAASPPCR